MNTHDLLPPEAKTERERLIRSRSSVTTQDLANTEMRIEIMILYVLKQMDKIMSQISDFLAKQKQFNDRQAAAIDAANSSVLGLVNDIKSLNDKITELQNSSGAVTPEDAALINQLEADGDALATKSEATATALKALDDQTPPVVPPPGPA